MPVKKVKRTTEEMILINHESASLRLAHEIEDFKKRLLKMVDADAKRILDHIALEGGSSPSGAALAQELSNSRAHYVYMHFLWDLAEHHLWNLMAFKQHPLGRAGKQDYSYWLKRREAQNLTFLAYGQAILSWILEPTKASAEVWITTLTDWVTQALITPPEQTQAGLQARVVAWKQIPTDEFPSVALIYRIDQLWIDQYGFIVPGAIKQLSVKINHQCQIIEVKEGLSDIEYI